MPQAWLAPPPTGHGQCAAPAPPAAGSSSDPVAARHTRHREGPGGVKLAFRSPSIDHDVQPRAEAAARACGNTRWHDRRRRVQQELSVPNCTESELRGRPLLVLATGHAADGACHIFVLRYSRYEKNLVYMEYETKFICKTFLRMSVTLRDESNDD